jgi:hypothetical protein
MTHYLSSLFLPKHDNRLVETDAEQHIYRNKIAEHELIKAPKFPECSENDRTIGHIWRYITETNADKPGFGERELLEVSLVFLVIFKRFDLSYSDICYSDARGGKASYGRKRQDEEVVHTRAFRYLQVDNLWRGKKDER